MGPDARNPETATHDVSLATEQLHTAKKVALIQKCDSLLEAVLHYEGAYREILVALTDVNRQLLKNLQNQISELKTSILHLEKKSIKKMKLVGTLTDIQRESRGIKLKPELGRKKDLYKIDEFLLRSYRALNFLNGKAKRN